MKHRNVLALGLALAACQVGAQQQDVPLPDMQPFGVTRDGQAVELYTLRNDKGMEAKLTNFGATLVQLHVPDSNGITADVVLGFDDVSGYQGEGNQYFGCIAGRVANRIALGRFELGGREYELAINNDPNHLHGGEVGFGQRVWSAEPAAAEDGQALRFRYTSPDGEEGYPGGLDVAVTYTLTDANELRIDYRATSDAPTPINLTHHSYFNLGGHGSPTVLDHELEIAASHYTPTDETLIPTGDIRHVQESALDFREPMRIGARVAVLDETAAIGYDHNFAIGRWDGELRRACRLLEPASGRSMEIWTTEPGLQLYCGNFLFGQQGKGGSVYAHRSGVCLETQHFPDAIHHAHFPDTVLKPGEEYTQTTVHRFSAR